MGGSLRIECLSTLGPLTGKAEKTLKVEQPNAFFSLTSTTAGGGNGKKNGLQKKVGKKTVFIGNGVQKP